MKITTTKLKRVSLWIIGLSFFALLAGALFPVNISLSQDEVNTLIAKKIPFSIDKKIKIPLTLKKVLVHLDINEANITMSNGVAKVTSSGIVSYKNKSVRFYSYGNIVSSDLYYDSKKYAFYAHPNPEEIHVHLMQEDLDALFLSSKKMNSPDSTKGFLSFIKSKSSSLIKDKYTENKEKILPLVGEKLDKVVEYGIIKALNKYPIYTLKNKSLDTTTKLLLNKITIENTEIKIKISTISILVFIAKWLLLILFVVALFYLFTYAGIVEVVALSALDVL